MSTYNLRSDSMISGPTVKQRLINLVVAAALLGVLAPISSAQEGGIGFTEPGGYGLHIYQVNSDLYPFVQVYFRTFDTEFRPLVNLNYMNIGLMVKGRSYDPKKQQYLIQTLRQREEKTWTVFVLDASGSMAGEPFNAAIRAVGRFLDGMRPQDEVAVLAVRDTPAGYDKVSEFERDRLALANRLGDVRADGQRTRLYDSIGAAMQMCATVGQGAVSPEGFPQYIISCSIVVFSDGHDEGSSLAREELNARITHLSTPIPIYSMAYAQRNIGNRYFGNLEALSKNSFGVYYLLGDTVDRMQQVVEGIQNIILSDYVVTFRSYIEVDGGEHLFRLGVEYPSGSHRFTYKSGRFEAIQPPPVGPVPDIMERLSKSIPARPDCNPYFDTPTAAVCVSEKGAP